MLLGELAARGAWKANTTPQSVADHFFLLQSPELVHLSMTTLGWSIEEFKGLAFPVNAAVSSESASGAFEHPRPQLR